MGRRGTTSERTQSIIEMRRSGKSLNEISVAFNVSVTHAGRVCRNAGMGGPIIEQRLSEAQVAEHVSKSGFDYVDGYTTARSLVRVRCRKCGGIFERNFHIFRDVANGTWKSKNECPLCKADRRKSEQERRESARKAEREREAQERAQRKAEQLSRHVNNQLIRRLATRVCKNCGKEFCLELSDYHSEIYCSEACQKRCHDRIKRDKRVRRMKTREMDKDITLEKLYVRDSGVCYLCGRICNWTDCQTINGQFISGKTYPSIDHVKPISKGGTHTWDNIKLACRHCNTVKGWR